MQIKLMILLINLHFYFPIIMHIYLAFYIYKSFYPTPLQKIELEFDSRTIELLINANFQLGKLNGLASNIVDIDMFLGSYVRKEALHISQIESTQATLEDILDTSNENSTNVDIEDVINYVKATNYSVELTKELPI